jgi:hypothetical protein
MVILLLLRHILHHPGTIPMPSAGWVALLALSSVIWFFCGRLLAGPPSSSPCMATAADRRRGGNVTYTDGGDYTTCPETPFQDADVGRYRRLLSHWKRETASAQPL